MNIAGPTRAGLLILGLVLTGMAGGCSSGGSAAATAAGEVVPEKLRVDGPVVAHVHATGAQVYTAAAAKDGALAWVFTAPDATFEGSCKGTHYKGPTWECAGDHSKVVGHKLEEAPAPAADAVPWLLLDASSHEGHGMLSSVTFIQRLSTTGGKAPADHPLKAGDVARVPYTADYVFFGPGAKRPG